MEIPPKALQHVRDGLKTLDSLEPGKPLHYCIVRLDGPDDAEVRVVFGDTALDATKEAFARVWSSDAKVKDSDRPKWQIARGAFLLQPDGLKTIPALRGNHVLAPSEVKLEMKAMRSSLADSGVMATPLKKVIDGKFLRAADTAKLDGAQAKDVTDDEKDLKADTAKTQAGVKALVERFKKLPIKQTVENAKAGGDEAAQRRAKQEAERVRTELAAIEDDAAALEKSLRGKLLGSTRYKDSLKALDELLTRVQAAQRTLEGELGFLFERTVLAGGRARVDDPILKTLRDLVGKANAARDDDKIKVLAEIWFAADLWLKAAGSGSGKRGYSHTIDDKLLAKVQEVYEKASKDLAKRAGVPINRLPSWLEQHHGKGMEAHGTDLDVTKNLARWLTANQRDLFRVHVQGGKLYQYNWWELDLDRLLARDSRIEMFVATGALELVPVESSRGSTKGIITPGYTGFVMSMGSDLYMTAQYPPTSRGAEQTAMYHSNYTAGLPVQAAGEMLVKNGVVEVVNPRSGHYRPTTAHTAQLLRRLEMQGIKVRSVGGVRESDPIVSVSDFLRDHGDEVPDADAFQRNDEATSRVRFEKFLADLFPKEKEEIAKCRTQADKLEETTRKAREARAKLATATVLNHDRIQLEVRKFGGERDRAVPGAETARRMLAEMKATFERKLRERDTANEELRGKDARAGAAPPDGYVAHLRELLARTTELDERLRLAIEAARA